MLPRPTDIMSLRLDNTERQTVELSDAVLSSTRYMASWLRQRSWTLPQNRRALPWEGTLSKHVVCAPRQSLGLVLAQEGLHAAAIHSLKHSDSAKLVQSSCRAGENAVCQLPPCVPQEKTKSTTGVMCACP